jgi:hypothetical protein
MLLLAVCIQLAAGQSDWINLTVYRTTPINYTGITNMDSGDAHGDAMFGLNQLLLPVICPHMPTFTWCANMQYLSGGSAHMVYSEFVVSTKPHFGDYSACNPDPKTGIFACEHYDQPSNRTTPKQCQIGFEMYHSDCLNGTIYKYLPYADEGACCAACTAEGGKCDGWNMPDRDKPGCQLLTAPLFQWDNGQHMSTCTAAQHYPGYKPDSNCWYNDNYYNSSFDGICDRKVCVCDAVENLAMGRELGAMCHHHGNKSLADPGRRLGLSRLLSRTATATATAITTTTTDVGDFSNYWDCNGYIFDACFDTIGGPADKVRIVR